MRTLACCRCLRDGFLLVSSRGEAVRISGDGYSNRVWVSHPLVIARHTVPWQSSRQAQSSLDSVTKLFELFCNFACFCPRLCVIEPRFCFFSYFFNEHIISALCRSVNNFFCFFEKFYFYAKSQLPIFPPFSNHRQNASSPPCFII